MVKPQRVLPRLSVRWKRLYKHPSTDLNRALLKPLTYSVLGGKNEGKSALVETVACRYPKIIDLFGSRDGEGLAWLRGPFKGEKILLLKSPSIDVECPIADVKNVTDVTLKDFEQYRVIISCSFFYINIHQEWYYIGKLIEKFWQRHYWREPWCIVVREASNLLASRQTLGDTQRQAIDQFTYFAREIRHSGFALCLDTLRWKGIEINIRGLSDYLFLKAVGIQGVPPELKFVFRTFPRFVDYLTMKVSHFVAISRQGSIGAGKFDLPYWHKRERENFRSVFNIRTKQGKTPFIPEIQQGKVGDPEHIGIIRAYLETGIGQVKLGEKIGRSSRTINKHINYHNRMIHTIGVCDKCERMDGKHQKTLT